MAQPVASQDQNGIVNNSNTSSSTLKAPLLDNNAGAHGGINESAEGESQHLLEEDQ